jgi:SagB-type dehydrogenase family enzyme
MISASERSSGASDAAGVTELLRLRPGVLSGRTKDSETYLLTHRTGESLGTVDAAGRALLERLAAGPAGPDELGEPPHPLVDKLRAGGWLAVTVAPQGRPLYTVVPHRRPPAQPTDRGTVPPGAVLSRFAVLRRDGDDFVLEHPDAWCRIVLHHTAILPALGGPAPGGTTPVSARLWRDLWWARMVVSSAAAEDAELPRRQWSPAERWFHRNSRLGHHQLGPEGFAGTLWARGRFDPLPARHPPFPGPVTALHQPDLAELSANDPSLTTVLESRRTVRHYDDAAPITADQLGELLFRCARNRSLVTRDGVEQLSRPYPSGGSLYELELYLVARRVSGLAAGLYHYDPQDHQLVHVRDPGQPVRRLLITAASSAGAAEQPQALLIVSARFGRVMWKYEQIGYALILKHVGILYQMIYSVATAMGLGVCALGTGDPDAFAEATGLDPWEESSVGELMLGSRQGFSAPEGIGAEGDSDG